MEEMFVQKMKKTPRVYKLVWYVLVFYQVYVLFLFFFAPPHM